MSVRLGSADSVVLPVPLKAEENSGVALRADVCRAMHRHDALRRQDEIEEAEDRLLHLAGIGGAADQDQLLGEVDRNDRLAAAAMPLGVGAEARQVDDREFGLEIRQLIRFRPDQQGADEEIVPRKLVDDANLDSVLGLGAAVEVGDVKLVLVGRAPA